MAHVRMSSTQRSCCVSQLFSLLHEILTDSHRACFKRPDSNFQRLDVVLNVAFQRDRIFLFISCLWRFGVCQLPCWCSHQPPSLLRPGILQPGWRDSTALFSQAWSTQILQERKSTLTFPSIGVGTTDTGVLCRWGIFPTNLHNPFPALFFLRQEPVKRQFPTYSTGVFASSSPINSTKTSFDQLHIFTRKGAPFAQFFHVCAFWHVTRGTWGHRVTKKRRTPKEICWSSSRTSNNNPVSSFSFRYRSRPESTPAATVVKHFVTSHSLFCIRAIATAIWLSHLGCSSISSWIWPLLIWQSFCHFSLPPVVKIFGKKLYSVPAVKYPSTLTSFFPCSIILWNSLP